MGSEIQMRDKNLSIAEWLRLEGYPTNWQNKRAVELMDLGYSASQICRIMRLSSRSRTRRMVEQEADLPDAAPK